MNAGNIIVLFIFYSGFLLMIQRAEAKRRLLVAIILIPLGLFIHRYANGHGIGQESTTALAAALVFNFVFWITIGRYNPVGSSDDITVIGLDD